MSNRKVWIFDEDERQLKASYDSLRSAFSTQEDVLVLAEKAFPEMDQYLEVLKDPETVCIIIDQRLKDTGLVHYQGIELAKHLRTIAPKLPLYILSNYADEEGEFAGDEWTVEDILDKSDLSSEAGRNTMVSRILRRVDTFEEIRDSREKRFTELLKKSLSHDLTPEELNELAELRSQRTAAFNAAEIPLMQKMNEAVEQLQSISKKLQKKE